MAINIRDEKTEATIRELARVSGMSITASLAEAAAGELARKKARNKSGNRLERMLSIAHRCAALPELDPRSADEILGYDQHGLPN